MSYYRQISQSSRASASRVMQQGKGPKDMSYEAMKDLTFVLRRDVARHVLATAGSTAVRGRFRAVRRPELPARQALMDENHKDVITPEDRHKITCGSTATRCAGGVCSRGHRCAANSWPELDVDPENVLGIEGAAGATEHFWHENMYGPHAFLGRATPSG